VTRTQKWLRAFFTVAVGLLSSGVVGRITTPDPLFAQAAATWAPFKGKYASQDGSPPVTRNGTYSRHSNGSTRRVILGQDGQPSVIQITSVAARSILRRDETGTWTTTPLSALPRPQTLDAFMRPGVAKEETTFEGKKALRLTRAADNYQIVVPELNFFPVEQRSGTRLDRVFEIVVGEQPDSDFVAPGRAVLKIESTLRN
jgi:hypothetical protein